MVVTILPMSLNAAELYRFRDDEGTLVLSSAIPPHLVTKGYQVVNERGRLLREVAPAPTQAEIGKRVADKQAALDAAEQREWEEKLMLRYASPADVEFARDQRISAIETAIASTMLNIERLKQQQEKLEAQAATMERSGQPLSPVILQNLDIVKTQIREKNIEVSAWHREQETAGEEFSRILKKIGELYGVRTQKSDAAESESGASPAAPASDDVVKIDLSRIDH